MPQYLFNHICILANICLHYALDDWFARMFKPVCQGDAMMVRYADDWIAGFQYHADAAHFQRSVEQRLKSFEECLLDMDLYVKGVSLDS